MLGVIYGIFLLAGLIIVFKKLGMFVPKPSLNSVQTSYLKLYNKILLSSNINMSEIKKMELIDYKFYFELTNELLIRFIKLGFNIREPITELRTELKNDLDQEKKIKRIESESLFQFLIVIFLTWFMITVTCYQVDLKISKKILSFIFIYQFLGLMFFLILKIKLRTKLFKDIHYVICRVLYWKSMLSVGLPISEVFKTKVFDWHKKFSGELNFICLRLQELVKETLRTGQPIKQELRYFMEELWFFYQDQGKSFSEGVMKLRFFTLILFFLPSYFVFVYFMLSTFTEQF